MCFFSFLKGNGRVRKVRDASEGHPEGKLLGVGTERVFEGSKSKNRSEYLHQLSLRPISSRIHNKAVID